MRSPASSLAPVDRQLVVGVAVTTAAAGVSGATFNFVVQPLTQGVGATEEQLSLLRQIPSIGALLVIFVAGAWGMRAGARRVVTGSSVLMVIGYAVVSLAPTMPVVSAGMLLGSVGKQGVYVVALGLLASRLTSDDDRAAGFSALAAVGPLLYLVAPIVATVTLAHSSWRAVTALWVVAALLSVLAARRLLPADDSPAGMSGASQTGAGEDSPPGAGEDSPPGAGEEMWTPALAGLVLASTVQFLSNGGYDGWTAPKTLIWLFVACAGSVALWILMTRLARPTLDVSILRTGGVRLLLLVIALVPFTNLWYYFTVSLQYIYGFTATASAVIMIPSQLAGVGGAWLVRRWIPRHGIRLTGTATLLAGSVSLFLSAAQTTTLPAVVPLAVLCLYSAAMTGSTIPLTNAIMNLAPPGGEGSASALRGAASSLGSAVGVLIMTGAVFTTYAHSLGNAYEEAGQDPVEASRIADDLARGLSSEEIASQLSVPLGEISDVAAEQKQALVDGYRAHGLLGGIIVLASAGVFCFNRKGLGGRAQRRQGSR